MRWKMIACLGAVVLVAASCNSKLLRPPAIVFVDGGEYGIETSLDEKGYRFPSVFFAFVPSRVPLHAGDALNFQVRDTGEPHTIAMGRTIDLAVSAVEALGANADLVDIENVPEMKKVPNVFPRKVSGDVPELNEAASEPCFLDAEEPPADDGAPACPEADQPEFDGTQSFYSSGVIEEGEPFRVKLAGDIKPGSHRFMCLVHRSSMTGTIDVVDKGSTRPTVAELRKSAQDEEREIASVLAPPARDAIRRESGPILAGTGPRGITRGLVSAFFPRDDKAEVGKPVGWRFFGTHSISFKPSREAKEGMLIEEGPEWRANADAWTPVGAPAVPEEVYAYPPSAGAFSIDGGTWDGEDAFSSGIIRAIAPTSVTYTLRFGKPGKYAYFCLVHQAMRGTIDVG